MTKKTLKAQAETKIRDRLIVKKQNSFVNPQSAFPTRQNPFGDAHVISPLTWQHQNTRLCEKLCDNLFVMEINHKFAVGSQPTAVCGAEAEARNAAAEM